MIKRESSRSRVISAVPLPANGERAAQEFGQEHAPPFLFNVSFHFRFQLRNARTRDIGLPFQQQRYQRSNAQQEEKHQKTPGRARCDPVDGLRAERICAA